MIIEFCEYTDDQGNVCNRPVEIVTEHNNHEIYVCKRCFYIVGDDDVRADKSRYLTCYEVV